jgi:hypothetical protein
MLFTKNYGGLHLRMSPLGVRYLLSYLCQKWRQAPLRCLNKNHDAQTSKKYGIF